MITACKWQQGEQKYQNAHTTDPVCETTPHKNTVRKNFYIREDTGTGRSKTGNSFKKSIDRMRNGVTQYKWNGSKDAEFQPASCNSNASVFCVKYFVFWFTGCQRNTDNEAEYHGNQESKEFMFLINKGCDTGKHHEDCLKVTHPSYNICNYTKIHRYTSFYARISRISRSPLCVVTIMTLSPIWIES